MQQWAIAAGALTTAIWAYLAFFRGSFWREPFRARLASDCRPGEGRVAVIIPARDEAEHIPTAVRSLLVQKFPGRLHVFVVDDNSSDATAQMAHSVAEEIGAADRVRIISGARLPPEWSGKLWALHQGTSAALGGSPDWLLFTDADVEHAPDSLAPLLARALEERADLASYMVRLHCRGLAEKLLIPAFVYFFLMLYPPRWISDPRRRSAGAAGGCILIRPQALARAGGLEAIRSEVIDDCALARAVKRSGGRVWLGLALESRSIRPYGSFAEIGRMISRTAFSQLRHSAIALLFAILGLVLTFLLPPALLAAQNLPAIILGVCSTALMLISYLPMVRFYRIHPLWILGLPFAALFYLGATVNSAFSYWSGRGGRWKGRVQDPATAPPR